MKTPMKRQSPFWVDLLKILVSFSAIVAILYFIPTPYNVWIANTYAFLVNIVIVLHLIAFAASYTNLDFKFDYVDKRLEINDIIFMRRMLDSSLRTRVNLAFSTAIFSFAVVAGHITESLYLYWTMIIWSLVFFISRQRLESLVSDKYRDKIVEHINKNFI